MVVRFDSLMDRRCKEMALRIHDGNSLNSSPKDKFIDLSARHFSRNDGHVPVNSPCISNSSKAPSSNNKAAADKSFPSISRVRIRCNSFLRLSNVAKAFSISSSVMWSVS